MAAGRFGDHLGRDAQLPQGPVEVIPLLRVVLCCSGRRNTLQLSSMSSVLPIVPPRRFHNEVQVYNSTSSLPTNHHTILDNG